MAGGTITVGGVTTVYPTDAEFNAALAAIHAAVPPLSQAELDLIAALKKQFDEKVICQKLIDELIIKFKEQVAAGQLTQADKPLIINKIAAVMAMISSGWLDGASVACNALTITAGGVTGLTQARKDYLQGKIDAAIVELNALP